jgi:hypothetical protein
MRHLDAHPCPGVFCVTTRKHLHVFVEYSVKVSMGCQERTSDEYLEAGSLSGPYK